MTNFEDTLKALKAFWDGLPQIECQGLCYNSCGPIGMSEFEHRLVSLHGADIPHYDPLAGEMWRKNVKLYCPALTHDGKCSIYEVRPTICRLWGLGRGEMACPHGCTMSGPRLRAQEILDLQNVALVIAGEMSEEEREFNRELYADPEVWPLFRRYMFGDHTNELQAQIQILVRARYREWMHERGMIMVPSAIAESEECCSCCTAAACEANDCPPQCPCAMTKPKPMPGRHSQRPAIGHPR